MEQGLYHPHWGVRDHGLIPLIAPAEEAFVAERTNHGLYKMNLKTGAGQLIYTFPAILYGLAFYDQDTLLVTVATLNGMLYSVNLKNNNVQLLLSGFTPGQLSDKVALESRPTALIGDDMGNLYRVNLQTLTVSTVATGFGSAITGIILENSSTALVMVFGSGSLYRVNLIDGTYAAALVPLGPNYSHIALSTNRNIVYVSNFGANQIKRFDLSTNTPLSDFGPTNAGEAIEIENSNSLLVGNFNLGIGGLYRVDLDTGATSRVDNGLLNNLRLVDIAVRYQ